MDPLRSAKSTVTCFRSPSSAAFEVRILSARWRGMWLPGEPAVVADVSGGIRAPHAQQKACPGRCVAPQPEHAGASIDLGAKDTRLLREAAASRNARMSLADNLAEIFEEAKRVGLANEDWAVGQYRIAQRRGKQGVGSRE